MEKSVKSSAEEILKERYGISEEGYVKIADIFSERFDVPVEKVCDAIDDILTVEFYTNGEMCPEAQMFETEYGNALGIICSYESVFGEKIYYVDAKKYCDDLEKNGYAELDCFNAEEIMLLSSSAYKRLTNRAYEMILVYRKIKKENPEKCTSDLLNFFDGVEKFGLPYEKAMDLDAVLSMEDERRREDMYLENPDDGDE